MNIRIEPLSEVRARELLPAFVEIDSAVGWTPWSAEQFLSQRPEKWIYSRLAFCDGDLSGFLFASLKDAGVHIHRLVVSPQYRSSGVGKALIEDLKEFVGLDADRPSVVTLKVDRHTPDAERFYRKIGFRQRFDAENDGTTSLWLQAGALRYGVHQPNYLPWIGYFAKIFHSDVFIILDDVQMPQGRSYVSRTRIRKGEDEQWLTVPVNKVSFEKVNAVTVADAVWQEKHLSILKDRYGKWPYFGATMDALLPVFRTEEKLLWKINMNMISAICIYIGIDRVFELSSSMNLTETSDDRIIRIGKEIGAGAYLSGSGGMNYQSVDKFADAGFELNLLKVDGLESDNIKFLPRLGYSFLETLFSFPPNEISAILRKNSSIGSLAKPSAM